MLGLVEFCRDNMPFGTAATPQCPELFWLAWLQSHHPFLSPQESECSSHDSVSKRLRGAGAHFCLVVHHLCRLSKWGLIYFLMERINALSITSLSHCVASKGLSPTMLSSAKNRPRKLPYEPAASCIL